MSTKHRISITVNTPNGEVDHSIVGTLRGAFKDCRNKHRNWTSMVFVVTRMKRSQSLREPKS